ncbi:MAG: dienelactone hydrolase family protein [Alphaproteobacteria bacterium]|nr:dienelactone hydrolase family protein [Alphaproteobacteria bacterium]
MRKLLVGLAIPALIFALAFACLSTGILVPKKSFAAHRALIAAHTARLDPDGAPRGVVLLFHGCGGVRSAVEDWAQVFRRAGYVALTVDSLAAHGMSRLGGFAFVCTGLALWGQERAGDVLAALGSARADPDLADLPVALASWSHGGWAAMEALGFAPGELPWGLEDALAGLTDGLAGVLFAYPYCGWASSPRAARWHARPPALALLAGRDSVVGAEPCIARFTDAIEDGYPIEVHVYPDADHSFDERTRNEFGRLAYDPAVTQDAFARGIAFLDRVSASGR